MCIKVSFKSWVFCLKLDKLLTAFPLFEVAEFERDPAKVITMADTTVTE
jgi:hypothetical protein